MAEMWETEIMCFWRQIKSFTGESPTDKVREEFIKWANDDPEDYKKWYLQHRQKAPADLVLFCHSQPQPRDYTDLPKVNVDDVEQENKNGVKMYKMKKKKK